MTIYRYSGTFEGFLSVVFEIYDKKDLPDTITHQDIYQFGLQTELVFVDDNAQMADRIKDCIIRCSDINEYKQIQTVFHSGNEEKEIIIFNYIRMLFKYRSSIYLFKDDLRVIKFDDMCSKLAGETHIIKGFLRFKELANGVYYAKYEPDNDITASILEYFINRLNDMQFIIHDTKRSILGLYNGKQVCVVHSDISTFPEIYTPEEEKFQNLWNTYFEHVTIKSRTNKRQQVQHLPKRYWKNMSEMQTCI